MGEQGAAGERAFWADAEGDALGRFRTLVNTIDDGIYQLDAEGRIVAINDAVLEMTGYSREELLGSHVSRLVTEADASRIEREIRRRLASDTESDTVSRFEITLGGSDGESVPCEICINLLLDDGEFRGTVGIVRDVLDRGRAEQSQHQEAVLRDVYEVISDRGRSFEEKVDALLAIAQDVIGTNYASLSRVEGDEYTFEIVRAPDDSVEAGDVVPLSSTNCERAIDTEQTLVIKNVREDRPDLADRSGNADWGISCYLGAPVYVDQEVYGTFCFYDKSPREEPFSDWEVTLVDLLSRWISYELTRREHEQTLEQYRAITQAANDVIVTIDERSVIQSVNPAVEDVLGYEQSELVGESLTALMPERFEDSHRDSIERYLETGEKHLDWDYIELPGLRADGAEVSLAVSFSEVEFEDERYFTGILRDITERKEIQRQLEASNERLEQFAYAVSHDLQEPLRTVSSYLQLIERRYEDELDEDGREFIDFAVDGAERMKAMIEGLLKYSRVETGSDPDAPVDLDAVLDDVLEDLQVKIEESDAEISVEPLPTVYGDDGQLRQVFQNLLSNAITYSGDEPPRLRVSAERDGSEWIVAVSDEGIGIDPENADRIFDVFQRLHSYEEYDGTGIGLALCQRIVERHGGDIWVESEPGEGSTFKFTLSAVDDADA